MMAWSFSEGDPCNRCGTPIETFTQATRKTKTKVELTGRSYYLWWYKCPDCNAMFMPGEAYVRAEKEIVGKP